MGVKANLSIWGMYKRDNTIFDDMSIPTQVDREILVDNILEECSEMQILYTNWDYLKSAIDRWSARMVFTWQKIADTLDLEYNPIENYNRTETYTDVITHTGTEQNEGEFATDREQDATRTIESSDSGSSTESRQRSESETSTNDVETLEKVNGYNGVLSDDTMKPKSMQVTDQDQSKTGSGTETGSGTTSSTGSSEDTLHDDTGESGTNSNTRTLDLEDEYTHNAHVYGNIGVTTSQQMIMQELELNKMNIYTIIIDDFKKKFCLSVYF